jgi:hypothetical protein
MTAQQAGIAARLFLDLILQRHPTLQQFHLFVLTKDRKDRPPILFYWQRKNKFGVSFMLNERDAAEAWLIDAIQAGYRPFYHARKSDGVGFSPKEVCDLLKPGAV